MPTLGHLLERENLMGWFVFSSFFSFKKNINQEIDMLSRSRWKYNSVVALKLMLFEIRIISISWIFVTNDLFIVVPAIMMELSVVQISPCFWLFQFFDHDKCQQSSSIHSSICVSSSSYRPLNESAPLCQKGRKLTSCHDLAAGVWWIYKDIICRLFLFMTLECICEDLKEFQQWRKNHLGLFISK